MNLYEIIQRLCKEHDITIASLERICGFGNGTIKKWGNATPSGDRLAKVADYFRVSVDYLLNRCDIYASVYIDSETAQIAQLVMDNTDMRMLFEIALKTNPKYLKAYISFLKELQEKE